MGKITIEVVMQCYTATGYHGTCWDAPLVPSESAFEQAAFADQLSRAYSPLDAVFFADNARVGDFFADIRQADPALQLPVMIQARVDMECVYVVDFNVDDPVVRLNGQSFAVPADRQALHGRLMADGYQGFVMRGDYQMGGQPADDIAVFDTSCIAVEGVRIKIDDRWTPTLSVAEARERFQLWCEGEAPEIADVAHEAGAQAEQMAELDL